MAENENLIEQTRIDGTTKRIDFTFDFVYLFISLQKAVENNVYVNI